MHSAAGSRTIAQLVAIVDRENSATHESPILHLMIKSYAIARGALDTFAAVKIDRGAIHVPAYTDELCSQSRRPEEVAEVHRD